MHISIPPVLQIHESKTRLWFRDDRLIAMLFPLLILAERCLTLAAYNFQVSDIDQALMWYGAREMSEGRFHEPCFYGQSYNTMFEGLLAVPFVKAGMPYHMALPVITSLLVLVPFLLVYFYLFRQKLFAAAALSASLLIFLPVEFSMFSSLPRGFMPGVFMAFLGFPVLLKPTKYTSLLFGFASMLGYSFNPNSLVITLPFAVYLILKNYRQAGIFLWIIIGAFPAGIFHYFSREFYHIHPEYDLHAPWPFEFSLVSFTQSRFKLGMFFDFISPVFLYKGWLFLPAFVLLIVILWWKKYRTTSVALLSCLCLIVLSFGLKKVHNGDISLNFNYARMFIGVPFLLMAVVALHPVANSRKILYALFVTGLAFFIWKVSVVEEKSGEYVTKKSSSTVPSVNVGSLKELCRHVAGIAEAERADLIVIAVEPGKQPTKYLPVVYAFSVLNPAAPPHVYPIYERRTWVLKENADRVFGKILFCGAGEIWEERKQLIDGLQDREEEIYILRDNKIPFKQLLDSMKLETRPF